MSGLKFVYPGDVGEDIISNADIEIKSAEGEWTKVGELTTEDINEKAISFEKTPVQVVRFVIKEDSGKWYQISEVYFTYEQIQESNTLRDMIIEAEELDITDKNLTLVSNVVDALIEAQKAYVGNSIDTTVVEANLRAAIDSLKNEVVDVFKEHLEIAIEEARKITENELSNIVPAVVTEFKAALEEAEALLASNNVTQEQINNSFDRLIKVMQMLSFEKGDKEALISLIDRISNLNEEEYISETWNKLKEKLEIAKSVVTDENALEAEVSKTYKDLIKAFLDLRLKPNKDKLEELINKAENINRDKYTEKSLKTLDKYLEKARSVFSNEDATEKEITKVNKELELALNELVEKDNNTNKPTDNNNSGSNSNDSNKESNSVASNETNKGGNLPKTGGASAATTVLFATVVSMVGATMTKKRK